MLQDGHSLSLLGDPNVALTYIIEHATQFMSACYGYSKCGSMSEARQKSWAKKTGKGSTSIPKLCRLPPTTEAFMENVKRAHLQVCIWKAALDSDPPPLDPSQYGFTRDERSKSMVPTTVPDSVELAPTDVLK